MTRQMTRQLTRRLTAPLAILLLLALIALDVARTPPNPFAAPAVFALGSGAAAVGGFCGALPD